MRFYLVYRNHPIALRAGNAVIGRSASCTVVLSGDTVSRRHAQLLASGEEAYVEDLDSDNGVFVNGERIERTHLLGDGDVIGIGEHALRFVAKNPTGGDPLIGSRKRPKRPHPVRAVVDTLLDDEDESFTDGGSTQPADPFGQAIIAARLMLDAGQPEEAEKMVAPELHGLLKRSKITGKADPAQHRKACACALDLARTGRRMSWLDYPFDLCVATRASFPAELTDALEEAVREVGVPERMRAYVELVRSEQPRLDPGLLTRLEALMR